MSDQNNGERSPMAEDDTRRRLVPPRVLTRDEALSNYATIAHHYDDFANRRLPQIERTVKLTYDMLVDHIAREDGIDPEQLRLDTEQRHIAGPRFSPPYNPDETPMGGVRFDPAQWEGIQRRFQELEEEKRIATATAQGVERVLGEQKKRLMFWVKLLATAIPLVSALAGLAVHLLRQ